MATIQCMNVDQTFPSTKMEAVQGCSVTSKMVLNEKLLPVAKQGQFLVEPMSEPSPTCKTSVSHKPNLEFNFELVENDEKEDSASSKDGSSDSEPFSEPALLSTMPSSLTNTNFCATRFRKSCYFDATVRAGAKAFAPYNHMLLPIVFTSPEEEYHQLKTNVCLWDVAVERQVELSGPDAVKLAEMLTPRPMGGMKVGECRYAIITDDDGMVLNDPLAMRLAEDKYWFSIADSDILLWAKALARGLDVRVCEPDVSPLAVQGPKSTELMKDLFGEWIEDLKFFYFQEAKLDGIPTTLIVARSGWSPERGYEIYLQDSAYGDQLWERIMAAGRKYSITPGVPNQIRRMEGGMLSFGSDMGFDHNAMELGLPPKWVGPGKKADFVGKKALEKLVAEGGPKRQVVGLEFIHSKGESQKLPPLMRPWRTHSDGRGVGEVTSVCFSPKMQANIAIATLGMEATEPGTEVLVDLPGGSKGRAVVRKLPFMARVP